MSDSTNPRPATYTRAAAALLILFGGVASTPAQVVESGVPFDASNPMHSIAYTAVRVYAGRYKGCSLSGATRVLRSEAVPPLDGIAGERHVIALSVRSFKKARDASENDEKTGAICTVLLLNAGNGPIVLDVSQADRSIATRSTSAPSPVTTPRGGGPSGWYLPV